MIKTEFYLTREDNVNLYRTYSDENMLIENQNGVQYAEAIDIENSGNTYTETTTPIPIEEEQATPEETSEALHILLGRR